MGEFEENCKRESFKKQFTDYRIGFIRDLNSLRKEMSKDLMSEDDRGGSMWKNLNINNKFYLE